MTEPTNDELIQIYWETAGRAVAQAAIAAHDVRRAEELAAYELTVSNLRAELEAKLAQQDAEPVEYQYRWLNPGDNPNVGAALISQTEAACAAKWGVKLEGETK